MHAHINVVKTERDVENVTTNQNKYTGYIKRTRYPRILYATDPVTKCVSKDDYTKDMIIIKNTHTLAYLDEIGCMVPKNQPDIAYIRSRGVPKYVELDFPHQEVITFIKLIVDNDKLENDSPNFEDQCNYIKTALFNSFAMNSQSIFPLKGAQFQPKEGKFTFFHKPTSNDVGLLYCYETINNYFRNTNLKNCFKYVKCTAPMKRPSYIIDKFDDSVEIVLSKMNSCTIDGTLKPGIVGDFIKWIEKNFLNKNDNPFLKFNYKFQNIIEYGCNISCFI